MALIQDLRGAGISSRQADMLGDAIEDSIVAAGNASQANAYQLTANINVISTATVSNNSVKMPSIASCKASFIFLITESIAASVNLYPATGEKFTGSATDVAVTIAANKQLLLFKRNDTTWMGLWGA